MPEVRLHEPREALTDEEDGFGFLSRLVPRIHELLEDGGVFLCEIGFGQAERAAEIVRSGGFTDHGILPDYAGIPRVLEATLSR